ncbi:ribonuclease P protein component [Candidatus Parcubacteria bacterium]|nr:ribonuclease P protein component [Candidatus Parcubacteria bacterium]
MFSKKQRIDREKIGKIMKNPDFSFKSGNLALKASKNNLPFPRFSVVISKKTEKNAVKRHFLKRKLISLIKSVENINNLDFVFFINNRNFYKNKEEIDNLISKCII